SAIRGLGANATPVLLRVDGAGKIDLIALDHVRYTRIGLPNPPPAETPLVLGAQKIPVANYPDKVDPAGLMGVQTITHMAYADGAIREGRADQETDPRDGRRAVRNHRQHEGSPAARSARLDPRPAAGPVAAGRPGSAGRRAAVGRSMTRIAVAVAATLVCFCA